MSLAAIFGLSIVLSIGFGISIVPMIRVLTRWGKTAYFIVEPGTNTIGLEWKRDNRFYQPIGDPQKDGAAMPFIGEMRHTFNSRPAWIVNRHTGSPMRASEEGRWEGIDGRIWLKKIADTKIQRVQRSGATDLVALVKYALVGLVIIGVLVLVMLGILAKGL